MEIIIQVMLISSVHYATKVMAITTDLKSFDGKLCPEVADWTCSFTTNDSVIRFCFIGDSRSFQVDGQNHPAGFELQYTDDPPISKGEYALSEPAEDLLENITRTLTVNNEELYNLGYRHICCGTLAMNLTSIPLDLDREIPTRPVVISVDLLVNTTSQVSAQIKTSSMVYESSRCQYKQNSYFITRVFSEQRVHTWQTNFNSSCTGSDCIITGSFPQPVAPGNITIEVEAVSQYNRSTAHKISTKIPDFRLTWKISNCHYMVLCSSTGGVGGNSCNIQFQSVTEPVTITVDIPVNQYYELDELKYGTTYTVQTTLKIANVTYTHEESFTTKERGAQCKQVQLITVILVSVGMASLSMCLCSVFIVVAIIKTAKFGNEKIIAKVRREYPESAQSSVVVPFEEVSDSKSPQVHVEQKENDLMPPTPGNMAAAKSPQFKFQFDPYGDGRSYNTLEKNCVELEQEKTFEKHNNASMDRAGDIYDSMEQPQAAHSEG